MMICRKGMSLVANLASRVPTNPRFMVESPNILRMQSGSSFRTFSSDSSKSGKSTEPPKDIKSNLKDGKEVPKKESKASGPNGKTDSGMKSDVRTQDKQTQTGQTSGQIKQGQSSVKATGSSAGSGKIRMEDYDNQIYFNHNPFTYYDIEKSMASSRLPQPSPYGQENKK